MSNIYFSELAKKVGFSIIDVGARTEKTNINYGIEGDFRIISKGCDYYGYEPDQAEFEKLKSSVNKNWKSQTYLSEALGEEKGEFHLNLYRQAGFSSKFEAKKDEFSLFSRSHYLGDKQQKIPVKVTSLDESIADNKIVNPSFIKIDIQGMELEVFKGAKNLLKNNCLGLRVEVYFHQIYRNQPLFSEVDSYLRSLGFLPFQFLEMHSWRRDSLKKFPFYDKKSKIHFSNGQLMHADMLYLKDSSLLKDELLDQKIRLALIAICYKHYDLAYDLFNDVMSKDDDFKSTLMQCQRHSKATSKYFMVDRSYQLFNRLINRLK